MRARGAIFGVLSAALILAACGSSKTASKPHASPSPKRTATVPIDQLPAVEAEPWRQLGVTVVPPDGFLHDLRVPSSTTVLNHTGGKIDDATARKWAEAMLRTSAWEGWGIQNLQSDFFTPALGPDAARADAFGQDESFIQTALSAKGSLTVNPAAVNVERMTLVVVPTDVQKQINGAVPAGYAWVEDQVGPAEIDLRTPDGGTKVLYRLGSGEHVLGIVGGSARDDNRLLGAIWYWDFEFSCSVEYLRTTCQS